LEVCAIYHPMDVRIISFPYTWEDVPAFLTIDSRLRKPAPLHRALTLCPIRAAFRALMSADIRCSRTLGAESCGR
jgi:hypothetical protein